MDCSPPGSSMGFTTEEMGISEARILERVAISFSRRYSRLRDQTHVSCTGRQVLLPLSYQGSPNCYKTELQYEYDITLAFKLKSNRRQRQIHKVKYNIKGYTEIVYMFSICNSQRILYWKQSLYLEILHYCSKIKLSFICSM